MKFVITARAGAQPDAGVFSREELAEAMLEFDEALAKAGVRVAAEGFHPGSEGAGTCAGFWIIDVSSNQEAVGWALRVPRVAGSEAIEVFQVHDATEIPEEIRRPEPAEPEVAA
jgi:hypothetical protein